MADKQEYEVKDEELDEVAGGVNITDVTNAVMGFWARLIAFFKGTKSSTNVTANPGNITTPTAGGEAFPGQSAAGFNNLVGGSNAPGSINDLVGGENKGTINDLTVNGGNGGVNL